MCGLVAWCAPEIDRARLARANDRLTHRGPDDAGCYVGAGVGLAARRLSIIDLAGGHQPLSNEDGTVWIAYNGEVYNAPDLRVALQAAGHQFRTTSDTEVIVHAYEEWGESVFGRLRGMFALALWDEPRRLLLAARDRFGIKPLYYARLGERLALASEVRPIFDLLPDLPRRADLIALGQLLAAGHVPSPRSPFAGVSQLPAAHTLRWENGALTIAPYWQLQFPPQAEQGAIDPLEAAAEFRRRLREAVAAWRLSDVPVGSLLSGGLDSSALAALLTELSGPIHTFTIAFDAASHDEAAHARVVAQAIGAQHHELSLGSAEFDHLPAVVNRLETPQCSATSLPIYLLYEACRAAGFKVILTGEGADELLGGYHWFDGDRRVRPWLALPAPLRRLAARLPLPVSPAGRRVLAEGRADVAARYALWQQVSPPALRRQLLAYDAPSEWLPPAAALAPSLAGRHPLHQFLWLEARTRLADFINLEVDRMSMAHSVEARPPFLDHELWAWCAGLPPELKLRDGVNKWLLREGMRGVLPERTRIRPKQGLAAPHAAWWRRSRLPAWAAECLTPDALAQTGYFHAPVVARLHAEHQTGRVDHSRLLTGVLTTQLWHSAFDLTAPVG